MGYGSPANLVNVFLLSSTSIGHEFAFTRHSYLVEQFKRRDIYLETQIFSALGRDDLLAWVVLAYPAAAACIMPLCRRLSVLVDLKLQFYIQSIVFVVGVVISGTAKDMNAVILGRAVGGAGGAGLYHGILYHGPDDALSTRATIDICFTFGLFLGPAIAGAFADSHTATWRWCSFCG
ncbi:hypothetical protein ACKVWM_011472 [Pyricularia oryzae]